MLDFAEELKKIKPSLELDDIVDAVYQEEMTDVMDLLNKVMDQQKNLKDYGVHRWTIRSISCFVPIIGTMMA